LIRQKPDDSPEWPDQDYYYEIILPYDFVPEGVFLKAILADPDKDAPVVYLVGAHRQGV
jgi:hypothetical protein